MSYTAISGQRSNRYPLMGLGNSGDGLGCGCSAQPVGYLGGGSYLGLDTSTVMNGVVGTAIIGTAVGIGLYQFYKIVTS